MERKISLKVHLFFAFCIFCFAFCILPSTAQVPQGFNYQAVARDATGASIVSTPLPVRITVQSDSLGGTIFWQELHQNVVSNSLGIINLVIGKGARQSSSTLTSFGDIDWSVSPKFIKTEIDYSGWKTMGVSRLWSVPYSLVAEDLAGSVKRLTVTGDTENMEEALFEVKNKTGQTVFAVYNEGVRVYVSEGDAKGLKGGFAVGGFGTDKAESTKYMFVGKDSVRIYLDTNPLTKKQKGGFAVGGYDLTKGTVQNYLDVSADSVRIYIDSNPEEKKLKGGFAVGGYDLTKGITGDYFNVSGKSDAETINGEARVVWYPVKEALLAGNVLIESKDSVGLNSWASGYRSKAIGNYSQALGYQSKARKNYSTAIGRSAIAEGSSSFAFGYLTQASGSYSYAFGNRSIATGDRSFAFGSFDTDPSLIDNKTEATGENSFAIGLAAKSSGTNSFSFGSGGSYMKLGSPMLTVSPNIASGNYSMAIGFGNSATATCSMTFGNGNISDGYRGMGIGYNNYSHGDYSVAIGRQNHTTMAAGSATTLGYGLLANEPWVTAVGAFNDTTSTNNIQFVVGCGSGPIKDDRKNAMVITKTGLVGLGTNTPAYKLQVGELGDGTQARANAWNLLSDARFKKDLERLDDALTIVEELNGYYFFWNTGNDRTRQVGLLAQEVEKVLPEVVSEGSDGIYSLDYGKVVPLLVEAIKEQQQQIEVQNKKIEQLYELIGQMQANLKP